MRRWTRLPKPTPKPCPEGIGAYGIIHFNDPGSPFFFLTFMISLQKKCRTMNVVLHLYANRIISVLFLNGAAI